MGNNSKVRFSKVGVSKVDVSKCSSKRSSKGSRRGSSKGSSKQPKDKLEENLPGERLEGEQPDQLQRKSPILKEIGLFSGLRDQRVKPRVWLVFATLACCKAANKDCKSYGPS